MFLQNCSYKKRVVYLRLVSWTRFPRQKWDTAPRGVICVPHLPPSKPMFDTSPRWWCVWVEICCVGREEWWEELTTERTPEMLEINELNDYTYEVWYFLSDKKYQTSYTFRNAISFSSRGGLRKSSLFHSCLSQSGLIVAARSWAFLRFFQPPIFLIPNKGIQRKRRKYPPKKFEANKVPLFFQKFSVCQVHVPVNFVYIP